MAVRGIRGATTVEVDQPDAIRSATRELLARLIEDNGIGADDVAGVWFTTTPDLHSEFPAVAARELGWTDVPLLCGQEMEVDPAHPLGIPRCIRILIHVNTDRAQCEMRFAYLRRAAALRAELDRHRSATDRGAAITASS